MSMTYKLLGNSGLRVSELCMGLMTFGEAWNFGVNKEESKRVFDVFAKAGGNFVDTAVNYTDGESEEFLGEFLKSERDHFVVATKFTGNSQHNTDLNKAGNGRKNMRISVEQSLRRLKTDYIDLYYLHVWDYTTDVEEVMRSADDLVRQGKILHFAFSDTPAWVVAEACSLAETKGYSKPVAIQAPYSLAWRDVERNTLPMAKRWDLAVCTWGILDGGVLSGKYSKKEDGPRRQDIESLDPRRQNIVDAIETVSAETGKSTSEIAINWTRQSNGAQVIPIIGARTVDQLERNLDCVNWELTPAQLETLEESTDFSLGLS